MTACRTLAVMIIEEMSTRNCAVCGAPGGLRGKSFMRSLCAQCSSGHPEPELDLER